jgi:hypothetical protein
MRRVLQFLKIRQWSIVHIPWTIGYVPCILALSFMLPFGCKPTRLDEQALMAFVQNEENGLVKKETYGTFTLSAYYKPTDLIVKQQLLKNTQREIDSLKNAYAQYAYFVLSLEKDGKDLESSFALNAGTFAEKILYLTSAFPENIRLMAGNEQYTLEDYLYTRSYGSGPSQFLLVFKRPVENSLTLTVKGYDLGFGQVDFAFAQADINNIPPLKL